MQTPLRLTDTNAASDSSGRTWGLEGNLVWWLIAGLGAGIVTFCLAIVGLKASLPASLGVAVIPLLLSVLYIFLLRHGKPPGYDRDLIESVVGSRGFAPAWPPAGDNPLEEYFSTPPREEEAEEAEEREERVEGPACDQEANGTPKAGVNS